MHVIFADARQLQLRRRLLDHLDDCAPSRDSFAAAEQHVCEVARLTLAPDCGGSGDRVAPALRVAA